MKSKRTLTEKIYLWWHRTYGILLILVLIASIFDGSFLGLFAYGLIPQGIFQVYYGISVLRKPALFRISNKKPLWIWAISSIAIMAFILMPTHEIPFIDQSRLFDQTLIALVPILPFIQFTALYFEKFKH